MLCIVVTEQSTFGAQGPDPGSSDFTRLSICKNVFAPTLHWTQQYNKAKGGSDLGVAATDDDDDFLHQDAEQHPDVPSRASSSAKRARAVTARSATRRQGTPAKRAKITVRKECDDDTGSSDDGGDDSAKASPSKVDEVDNDDDDDAEDYDEEMEERDDEEEDEKDFEDEEIPPPAKEATIEHITAATLSAAKSRTPQPTKVMTPTTPLPKAATTSAVSHVIMKSGRAVIVAGPAPPKPQPMLAKAKPKSGSAAEGYAQNQKEEAARMKAEAARLKACGPEKGIVGKVGPGKR